MSRRSALALFMRTGEQDCENVFTYDEYEDLIRAGKTTDEIIRAEELAMDSYRDKWIDQWSTDDFDGVDPSDAFAAWKVGWLSCARPRIAERVAEYKADKAAFRRHHDLRHHERHR